jgi:DNA-binding LytR/AlgR family response regulator
MRSLRVLIVEDDPAEGLLLEADLLEMGHQVCGRADGLREALGLYLETEPDILLIDILLHGKKDGIAIADRISRSTQRRQPFIFLTNLLDKATFEDARSTYPLSYLLKPFNKLELQYAIELAASPSCPPTESARPASLFIKKGNHLVQVPLAGIHHIQVEGKYSQVFSEAGKFLVELPLKELLERLEGQPFVRVNRNSIVNLREVKEIELTEDGVLLRNGTRLYMSRRYKADFLERFRPLR